MANKRKYDVGVMEVHVQTIQVEAESEEAAIDLVRAGRENGVEIMLEYSHTMDSGTWTAEEAE